MAPPKKGKKTEGFHSAAGLIRYFDAEDSMALKVDPKAVIALAIFSIIIIEVAKVYFPY